MRGKPELQEERGLRERLSSVLDALKGGYNVQGRLAALSASQRAREEASSGSSGDGGSGGTGSVDLSSSSDVRSVQHQLETQRKGVEQLLGVLGRDARDLRIIVDTLEDARRRSVSSNSSSGSGKR